MNSARNMVTFSRANLTRRTFLQLTAAGVAATTLAARRSEADKASAATRPNILWICTDQQRYDTITSLGNPHIRTPNLDKSAKSGVAFTHAHCQTPICTPSRTSFLTGMYPDTRPGCINGNDHWDDAMPLITKTLADAGYDCGLSGKFHLSSVQGRIEKRPDDGYQVFHWPPPYEFSNLWDDPVYTDVRFKLMTTAFDAAAFAADIGSRRVGGF